MQQVSAQPPPIFLPVSSVSTGQQAVIPEVVLAPSTLPGFYPHSEWAALGPVHVGVRSESQAPSPLRWDLGCWAPPSTERSLKDQPVYRSHPNKAVDVAFNQTSEKQR
jgi:hypothetical protein